MAASRCRCTCKKHPEISQHPPLKSRPPGQRPLLIYDGDCGFCVYWARYWQKLTGDRVEYRPYQEVAAQYPDIPQAEFQRAVQYIAPDGTRASAAEASFLTLSHASGKGFWLYLYKHVPGFAPVAEWAYAFTAAHRPAFYRVSLLLWGKDHEPPRYELVSLLFLRLLGLIYLSAFVSFAVQAQGLIGSHGILPLAEFVNNVAARFGPERFYLAPMVFWLDDSDAAITAVCWAGAGLSLLLVVNVLPRLTLFLLFALYLSLVYAGQTFMTYQWDLFLLETGFAALLMSFATMPGIWLATLALVPLHVHVWRGQALEPRSKLVGPVGALLSLSHPASAHADRVVRRAAAARLFEIRHRHDVRRRARSAVPDLRPAPLAVCRGLRLPAAREPHFPHRELQLVQSPDHAALPAAVRRRGAAQHIAVSPAERCMQPKPHAQRPTVTAAVSAVALLLVFCSLVRMDLRFGGSPPEFARTVDGWFSPLNMVSAYGLFSIMTTKRREIVIEGSYDGVEWHEYEFRYKPGDLMRAPPWNIPHQPRLDWQMWFAALDNPQRLRWFWRFLERLLENEPTVTALLASNPFADKPPLYVRAQFYDYTFAGSEEKAAGQWWDRQLLGQYFPAVHLKVRPGQ